MTFITDKQTREDLNISGRFRLNSISRIFDHTITSGGSQLMDALFQQPLSDERAINQRSAIFSFFAHNSRTLPITGEEFDIVSNYLRSGGTGNMMSTASAVFSQKVMHAVAQDTAYEKLQTDIRQTINMMRRLSDFIGNMPGDQHPYHEEMQRIEAILLQPALKWAVGDASGGPISFMRTIRYDHIFRNSENNALQTLVELVSWLDVYLAVGGVARDRGFSFAVALPADEQVLDIAQLYHPGLEGAVGNSIRLDKEKNVIFLTGANMAGKSTLMKSLGISLYLGHMGFPIAADKMVFSIKDGLFTSINVPDDLSLGHSHFYAEVLRVKKVAEAVAEGQNLVAIFDELFKGTNVKDAYDATLAISEAFSENHNCLFVISTHIIEVGEALMSRRQNFTFSYMPTVMEGAIPRYTYELSKGITSDRQGMIIIENEGILEILNGSS